MKDAGQLLLMFIGLCWLSAKIGRVILSLMFDFFFKPPRSGDDNGRK